MSLLVVHTNFTQLLSLYLASLDSCSLILPPPLYLCQNRFSRLKRVVVYRHCTGSYKLQVWCIVLVPVLKSNIMFKLKSTHAVQYTSSRFNLTLLCIIHPQLLCVQVDLMKEGRTVSVKSSLKRRRRKKGKGFQTGMQE